MSDHPEQSPYSSPPTPKFEGLAFEQQGGRVSNQRSSLCASRHLRGCVTVAKDHGPSVKNDKQYEGLRKKGMSKQRAARIANTPDASKKGGKKSSSGGRSTTSSKAGGTKAQKAAAGRKGGRKSS